MSVTNDPYLRCNATSKWWHTERDRQCPHCVGIVGSTTHTSVAQLIDEHERLAMRISEIEFILQVEWMNEVGLNEQG